MRYTEKGTEWKKYKYKKSTATKMFYLVKCLTLQTTRLYHSCDTDTAEALHMAGEGKYFLLRCIFFPCLFLADWILFDAVLLGYLSHSDNRQGILPEHLASFRACIIFKVAASGLMRKTGKAPATHNAVLLSTAPFQHCRFLSCVLEPSVYTVL